MNVDGKRHRHGGDDRQKQREEEGAMHDDRLEKSDWIDLERGAQRK